MASLKNDVSTKQIEGNGVQREATVYDDEISLMDYFIILWKRKWFILLASVLPAFILGLAMFLGPRDYNVRYMYNTTMSEKDFMILKSRFYSMENLKGLSAKLKEAGLERYAQQLIGPQVAEKVENFGSFEIFLPEAKGLDEFEKILQEKKTLWSMSIRATSEENIFKIALVARENVEQILPLYSEKEQLKGKIVDFKEEMASIEEARYSLNQQLERKKATLEKLKNSGSEGLDKLPSDIILQFNNVGGDNAFLPLPYQIQAAKTQIINFEEQIRANKEKYDYYTGLLKLDETLFSHVKKLMPSYYTLEQFCAFLSDTLAEYKEDQQQLQDYLKAYIKRIENKIANVIPLVENPKVYPVAKGTVKKSAVVFAIALMLSVFAAVLLEGRQKRQSQVS